MTNIHYTRDYIMRKISYDKVFIVQSTVILLHLLYRARKITGDKTLFLNFADE
jgi:hypothetical protein